MRAKIAVVAVAILFGGLCAWPGDAEARSRDDRHGKPGARAAAGATPAARQAARPAANRTARGSNQRSREAAQRTTSPRGSAVASNRRGSRVAYAGRSAGISCVPYARQVTGMAISGNGRDWWHNAAGLYDRGNRPEVGAVMAFPGSGGMRAGHVAVVERVVSAREVLIHHANWGGPGIRRGSIMRGVSVIDVSPGNDWTQVRVQVGHSNDAYGRTYPVYGFIYNRPHGRGGAVMASATPRQVGAAQAVALGLEEVALAPTSRR